MRLTKAQIASVRRGRDSNARGRAGFWQSFFINAFLYIVADLLRPKPDIEDAKPAGLGDFQAPTATEQRVIPLIWGTVQIKGPNVIWYGDLIQEAITEEIDTGLFSSEDVIVGFRYFIGVQSGFCMGEVDDMTRVWIGEELVLDATSSPITDGETYTIFKPDLFGGEDLGQGGVVGIMRFFAGSSSQSVSSYLAEFQQEDGDTPAYHGLCYTAPATDPTLVGTSPNIKPWRWEIRRFPNGLALSTEQNVDGGANLANVIYEALTDTDWGLGEATSSIDTTSFTAAALTLAGEDNGFSFILDRQEKAKEMIERAERQMEGVVFKDQLTGLWTMKLIRADYDVDTVTEVNATNLIDVPAFTGSTYAATSNDVTIPFNQFSDEYKGTSGYAQDMANVLIVGGSVSVSIVHPGIKSAQLATDIAWRELRTLSIPLAQATLIVDRSLYALNPGDPFAFTDEDLGFDRLPMRIKSIDKGSMLDGKITIDAVQDVFFTAAGVFDPNPGSGWEDPGGTLVAFPSDEQLAFEAPRALTARDPNSFSATTDKIYAAARKQAAEVTIQMVQSNAVGTPDSTFEEFGEVFQFMLLGELTSALTLNATVPHVAFSITPTLDSQALVLAAFPTLTDIVELGTSLLTLCYIGDSSDQTGEFFLVQSAQTSGSDVQLNNIYRGVMDSVQLEHDAGDKVYLIFVGAGISTGTVLAGNNVDVKLLSRAAGDLLAEASATTITFQMDNRVRRPYPPGLFSLDGVVLDSTLVSLESDGTVEDVGILVDDIVRRDFRIEDEISQLAADAATLFSDFPTANTTTVEVEVRNGATVLTSTTGISGTSTTMRKFDILAGLDTTTLPASLSVAVRQSHTFDSVVYTSRDYLVQTFTVDDPLVGKHAFGELDDAEVSTTFTVTAPTVDHVFSLSTSFTLGDVDYRINGGTFLTLIAAGGTAGTIPNASLSTSDTIEVRHSSSDTAPQKLLTMTVSSTEEAYAILIS